MADQPKRRSRPLSGRDLLFEDRAPESVYLRVLTSLFRDFVEESGEEAAERGKTGFYESVVWNKLCKFQRDGMLGAIESKHSEGRDRVRCLTM